VKLKIAQILSYRFFHNFGSKCDSPQQINCENFIIDCMVSCWAILNQRQVFTILDKNWIAHALYLSVRSCDAMYRGQESKSKWVLFCRKFITLFLPYCFGPRLEFIFVGVWIYCYIYQRDFNAFQVLKWFSLLLEVTCIIFVCARILT